MSGLNRFASPKPLMLMLMGLLVGVNSIHAIRMSKSYPWIFGIIFTACFVIVCWHLFRSVKGATRGIASIGKPNHPKVLGYPKWAVYLIGIAIFFSTFLVFDHVLDRRMYIYNAALADLQASVVGRQTVGTHIEPGWSVNINYEADSDNGHAEMAMPVSGSLGKGKLIARATKAKGQWKIIDLHLIQNPDGTPYNIPY